MAKWLERLERMVGGGPEGGSAGAKRVNAFRWLLLLGLTGVAFMILNDFAVKEVDPPADARASPSAEPAFGASDRKESALFRDYEQAYQDKLKELLQKIVGVGDVDVVVTIDSTEETVVHENRRESHQVTDEQDTSGAKRHTTQVTREGQVVLYEMSSDQTPIVLKTVKPRIRGGHRRRPGGRRT